PVMDGYQATRRIREHERRQGVEPALIVAVTAHAMRGERAQCVEAGMDDYLAKPVDQDALLAFVEKRLGRARAA
ncbi:MAG: response regulator, partial [Pseudomonadota bacterium]